MELSFYNINMRIPIEAAAYADLPMGYEVGSSLVLAQA